MQNIDFIYDFGSPNAYLAHKVLPEMAARMKAKVTYMPVLLGGVFKATNNQSPFHAFAGVKGKLDYERTEIRRFVQRHSLPFTMNPHFPINTLGLIGKCGFIVNGRLWRCTKNPHFPINTLGLMRGATYAVGKEWESKYIDAVFNAMWVTGQNMGDVPTISSVLEKSDLPVQEILQATQQDEVKQALISATNAACRW